MAFDTLVALKQDALWLAGEKRDGTSPFDAKAVDYVNEVQLGLMVGQGLVPDGARALPLVDWWWARDRGVFITDPVLGKDATVTVTEGTTTVVFSIAPETSVAGYRLRVTDSAITPRITAHTAKTTTATLDARWTEPTATKAFHLFKAEVTLATDFLRFAGPPVLASSRERVRVLTAPTATYDPFVWGRQIGTPEAAVWLGPTTLELNAVPEEEVRFEYDYVKRPPTLSANADQPLVPLQHRRTLSLGAAAMIARDNEDSRFSALVADYYAHYVAMLAEHLQFVARGTGRYGAIVARGDGARRRLATTSGVELD